MNLYKVYNLPALHPELKVEFTYELEGEYLDITKNKLYITTSKDSMRNTKT